MSWEAVRTKTVCFSDKSDISLGGWIVELVLDSQKVPCLLVGIQDTLSQPADKSAAAKGLWITTSYLMVTILDNTFRLDICMPARINAKVNANFLTNPPTTMDL